MSISVSICAVVAPAVLVVIEFVVFPVIVVGIRQGWEDQASC
jgi:hypothetical protein